VTLAEVLLLTDLENQLMIHSKSIGFPIVTTHELLIQKWIEDSQVYPDRMTSLLVGDLQPLLYQDSFLKDYESTPVSLDVFSNDLPLSDLRAIR